MEEITNKLMETKLTPIKRYAMIISDFDDPSIEYIESNDGEWVKNKDISQLLQQRDELMEASKDMITLWEKLFESFPMLKNEPKYLKAKQVIQKHQI